ncbi:5-dehydro-2-deoxygluconokinase [Sphingomonas sp. PP-F2F-A104-K0414]|uniref:bifunctional 5-dehydro-2-deoxygluconokinase/5-dehydro-2- deoxyphosphogluconate aldolase n=1 Tax=Sphingomonas sp. PP-F2F-A104-K0414 TaxID=2135661 RepID=UPI0010E28CA1|nr:5-dehydro-2-deoxygluconokinase [Sphingomonas sp. PP-F2F-A104-K0414]TCP96750.1 5-dehydro-2-deoxygluconokinase [Sphingomonas sp. PP-F2F-A104-K0414]
MRSEPMMKLELITVGRSCVDLYGEQIGGRLEDMASFGKYVGGSPTNTAIGAARLGLRSAVLTRVGNDHMGRFIREQLVREGVATRGVLTDRDRLTALVLLGIRDPETFPLIFYRDDCADMALCEADVDPAFIATADAVLVNGTHLSQRGVFAASMAAAHMMHEGGGRVVFDVDFRPVLWGLTPRDMGENRFVADFAVTATMQQVLPLVDLVVGTEQEIHILGGSLDTLVALAAIRRLTAAPIVVKRAAAGSVVVEGDSPARLEDACVVPGYPVEVFNALGAGDAFMAGFLRGWLRGKTLATSAAWGNACGALVVSRHGCAPAMPGWDELRGFLARKSWPYRLRQDRDLEQQHWIAHRARRYDTLTVLAVDHRTQFDEMVRMSGPDARGRVASFKMLVLRATDRLAAGDRSFGVLLDGGDGARALEAAADLPYWTGRPIEVAGSRPLRFESGLDPAVTLRGWPVTQVVKCLVYYRMDDADDLRAMQDRQLVRLFEACRATRHELLLEVIVSAHGDVAPDTTARVLDHLYGLGIHPDWWKLEPAEDHATWNRIAAVIDTHDPACQGVLLLGLSAAPAVLLERFEVAAAYPIVKGFAVGRTIWHTVATQWLDGAIDEDAAMRQITANFQVLVEAWRTARARSLPAVAGG